MKQRSLMKRVGAVLMAAALTISTFPQFHTNVYAAGNQLPTEEQFATVDELKNFDTNDGTENKAAKVYFGNNNQKWWIAGSQQKNGLTLFAASPLQTEEVVFNSTEDGRKYNGQEVYSNHYGASDIKKSVNDLETSYFTGAEQDLMNDTTIYTKDTKNNSVYSTVNKLYLAYGYVNEKYITVGTNSQNSLNDGLRIDMSYLKKNYSTFWLRAPSMDVKHSHFAVIMYPGYNVSHHNVCTREALVPGFELNLSSVIFASVVPVASSDGQLQTSDAFTLRHKSQIDIGTATISQSKGNIAVTDVTNENTYLVVQNSQGAWAKKVSSNDVVFASDIDSSLTSFENCKVWLETTSDRITYAEEATQGNGHNVKVNVGENLTVNGGNILQTNVSGNITEIIVKANDGYYLPDDYKGTIQGLNGLNVKDVTKTGFTISGTPTSDVTITLPAATVLPKANTPEVTISKTATSITATVTNHQTEFGNIEYKWNDGDWEKDKNTLSNLKADTTYQLAVRFKGNGFYQPSDEYSIYITTLKDGSIGFVAPSNLTITYKEELKLSDLALPQGWSWENGDTSLSVGTKSYPATFDTTSLESTTDFSNVDGYDPNTHKVTKNVEVEVIRANSVVTITTQSLDKAYDGNVVTTPEYTTSGSNVKVTIKWQENTGSVDTPKWEDLKSAPSTVGTYRVVVELAGNDNYNSASTTLDFVISQATNTWTEELSIIGWKYNENANAPTARAQFGDVTFTYSSEKNGTYTNEVPKNAGTWYVKATVVGTENYTGLESIVPFEISQADYGIGDIEINVPGCIIGSDRYDTAAKVADELGSYDTAVLVNATSTMSDGLSASGLAGKEDAAILLTKKDSIPKATMDRLKKVKKVYIIGGENAISQKVYSEITKNVPNIKIERLGGKTRVETSELVAKEIGNYKKAFVVNGFKGEADAISASAVSAREEAPILLTNGKTSTHDKKSGVEYYVVGGDAVVDKSIASKYDAEVLAGDDRYKTNREVINEFYGASETLYFANGETLVDALTASTIAKDDGLVLVGRKSDNSILNRKNTIQIGGMKFDVDFEK